MDDSSIRQSTLVGRIQKNFEPSVLGVVPRLTIKGFVDAYLTKEYCDGVRPKHSMVVFVPLPNDDYRLGWLIGLQARAESKWF